MSAEGQGEEAVVVSLPSEPLASIPAAAAAAAVHSSVALLEQQEGVQTLPPSQHGGSLTQTPAGTAAAANPGLPGQQHPADMPCAAAALARPEQTVPRVLYGPQQRKMQMQHSSLPAPPQSSLWAPNGPLLSNSAACCWIARTTGRGESETDCRLAASCCSWAASR